jgi:hypothetical protein
MVALTKKILKRYLCTDSMLRGERVDALIFAIGHFGDARCRWLTNQIARLKREVAKLKAERDILKKPLSMARYGMLPIGAAGHLGSLGCVLRKVL